MFPKYRHKPVTDPDRKRCPVCNLAVYSATGIHPQCALNRAVALEKRIRKEADSQADAALALAYVATGDATKTPIATS
jgi:hypothetical protein